MTEPNPDRAPAESDSVEDALSAATEQQRDREAAIESGTVEEEAAAEHNPLRAPGIDRDGED